jgi:chemotaxis methyl-accepting protein methylase
MSQPTDAADAELSALLDKIRRERGFDARQYKPTFLRRRLAGRLRACQVSGYRAYSRVLDRAPEEYRALLAALTINLTTFFRDPPAFAALRDKVLLPLIARREARGERRLRLWSAGCASGEETYSLAILLRELLGARWHDWRVELLGSDVDDEALAQARAARYAEASLRSLSPERRLRFTRALGGEHNGERQLLPAVTQAVRWRRLDLLHDRYPRSVDVLLCRNVLIYFNRGEQERLFERFYAALAAGGGLLVGRAEIPPRSARQRFEPLDAREHLYAKRSPLRAAARPLAAGGPPRRALQR